MACTDATSTSKHQSLTQTPTRYEESYDSLLSLDNDSSRKRTHSDLELSSELDPVTVSVSECNNDEKRAKYYDHTSVDVILDDIISSFGDSGSDDIDDEYWEHVKDEFSQITKKNWNYSDDKFNEAFEEVISECTLMIDQYYDTFGDGGVFDQWRSVLTDFEVIPDSNLSKFCGHHGENIVHDEFLLKFNERIYKCFQRYLSKNV